ncbi:outer membrane protein [Oceaniglobus trochenteri]|uniref:outer membrane protein n=1 Tax=Oceaniglobus trochenteri TaxID=2763260 RepID=UPI001CFFCA4A|nr:outer membrane beta-barrel protein [Oceaniglobus trochenteri]
MKFLTTTAIAALVSAPALAGGMNAPEPEAVIPAPAPVIAPAFSGGDWTGGYVGANLAYGGANQDVDGNGAVGGVQAGYLYDFGQFVLGGELGLNAADVEFDGGAGNADTLHTLKLKGGYDVGRTLIYGTVGAAQSSGTYLGTDYDETGYLLGAGVDYMLTDSVSLGGEVNHSRFEDINGTGDDIGITTVGANVNYRF